LTNNKVTALHEVANIGNAWTQLEFLTFIGNPVVRRQHYRLYAIVKIPTLRILDFVKVKEKERNRAKRLAISAAGAALEEDVKLEYQESEKDLVIGTNALNNSTTCMREVFEKTFTNEQQLYIKDMITNASSLEEIESIEKSVKEGNFTFPRSFKGSIHLEAIKSTSSGAIVKNVFATEESTN